MEILDALSGIPLGQLKICFMDAAAYLTRQGWRGEGYSLDPKNRGIKKRLLVSKKQNQLGVGKKKFDAAADQWWQGALEGALKGLNVAPSVQAASKSKPLEAKTSPALLANPKWRGLYQSFVRGSTLEGTMSQGEKSKSVISTAGGLGVSPAHHASTTRHSAVQESSEPATSGKHTRFDSQESPIEKQRDSSGMRKVKTKRKSSMDDRSRTVDQAPQEGKKARLPQDGVDAAKGRLSKSTHKTRRKHDSEKHKSGPKLKSKRKHGE